jgi:hypothetical protein
MIFFVSWQLFETLAVNHQSNLIQIHALPVHFQIEDVLHHVHELCLVLWTRCPRRLVYLSVLQRLIWRGGAKGCEGEDLPSGHFCVSDSKDELEIYIFLFKLCNLPLLMSNWGIIVKYASKYYLVKPKLTSPVTTTYIFGNYTLNIFFN